MIISHKYKFIYIKTAKTASTSLEIALSRFCGPDDIITRINRKEDEELRGSLGYPGPQNSMVPLNKYTLYDVYQVIRSRKLIQFPEHASAVVIKRYIDERIWNGYYKFTFERNPFDKVISLYYHRMQATGGIAQSLSEFILKGKANNIPGYNLYTINEEIVVDRVFKYEELGSAIVEIQDVLNLPEALELPRTKSKSRKDKRQYREILGDKERKQIERVFAREMVSFDYKW